MVSTRVDASTEGVARWFGTWLWSAPSDARAGGPAAYALRRLAGWTGAAARGGVAIVGGVAGLIGVAPSASLAWVVPAVVFNVAWAAFFAYIAIVRGLVSWLMAADVVVAVGFGLAQARLAPHEVLPTGASWIAVSGRPSSSWSRSRSPRSSCVWSAAPPMPPTLPWPSTRRPAGVRQWNRRAAQPSGNRTGICTTRCWRHSPWSAPGPSLTTLRHCVRRQRPTWH